MGRAKLKAPALTIGAPHDRDEADKLIFELGKEHRERAALEIKMNGALALIKDDYETQAAPINQKISALMAALQTYCEANRAELCPGKLKTVKFGNGEVSWRFRPPKVTLRGVKKIIEWCRAHRRNRFLRVTTEVNKAAMLAHPESANGIPGVKIGSAGEDFVVKPFESELEEVA